MKKNRLWLLDVRKLDRACTSKAPITRDCHLHNSSPEFTLGNLPR